MTTVVVAGASGLVGSALVEALKARGTYALRLVRRAPRTADEREWNPAAGELDPAILDGADAIISLGGASVGRLPWTKSYRHTLLHSRISTTGTVAEALLQLGDGAPAFISASAVGFYGSQPGEVLTEASQPGDTFLARLCMQWEGEARKVEDMTPVTLLRTAPIIDRAGVLGPMMKLTSFGLGGPLGSGTQMWPWISLRDEVQAILHVLDQQISGPVNLTGPQPASANDIGRELARHMRRPFWLPAPEWALKLALSAEATESLLTSDAHTVPEVLTSSGFQFAHASAAEAITAALAN